VISLIGLNIILLLLLVFLILRNVVKLVFERKKKVLGSKLKTKLVLAFITLTLVPTVVLFFIAIHFITSSIENWFSIQVEGSLQESLVVAQVYYQGQAGNALFHARSMSQAVTQQRMLDKGNQDLLAGYLQAKLAEYNLGAVELSSPQFSTPLLIRSPSLASVAFPPLESKMLQEAFRGKEATKIQSVGQGDLIRGLVPVFSPQNPREVIGVLGAVYFVPQSLVSRVTQIATAFEDYKQLSALKNPIKFSYLITLSLVTLLIVFSATWFGLFLAKGITEPVQKLVEGTQKIVKGNLDFAIPKSSGDEIGTLVDSFNQMTRDLKSSKSQVEKAHGDLSKTNLELEQRRRYMEVVLRDVGTGVISLDSTGRIRTINRSAEKILGIKAAQVVGKAYTDLLQGDYLRLADELVRAVNRTENRSITRQVKLRVGIDLLTLLVKVAILRDEGERYLGMVVVVDDLTQLQKAQRAEAWREVARRIAHEIKNPLTPIQLSAQRLRKRYLNQFGQDGIIFDECTKTIITQVEELKNLVNEFSSFARMPAANPNNAVAAVEAVAGKDGGGQILIESQLDPLMNLARIEVSDNGGGVAAEDKPFLFEPYFSTKPGGTGLGLAIVNTIISDHHGYIRVKDNLPQGSRFIIELPIQQ
jgi:two-component system nitrogen regulation sensor histidine kinase NtrY